MKWEIIEGNRNISKNLEAETHCNGGKHAENNEFKYKYVSPTLYPSCSPWHTECSNQTTIRRKRSTILWENGSPIK